MAKSPYPMADNNSSVENQSQNPTTYPANPNVNPNPNSNPNANPNQPNQPNLSNPANNSPPVPGSSDPNFPSPNKPGPDLSNSEIRQQTDLSNPANQSQNPTKIKPGSWGGDKSEEGYAIIDSPNLLLGVDKTAVRPLYPFMDLKSGQGAFIPIEQNSTSVKLLDSVYKSISVIRNRYGLVEYNEFGNEVLEQVVIKTRKRNADGSYPLDGEGKFIYAADMVQRPRIYGGSSFIVKTVVKGDEISSGQKAPADGVLVIRLDNLPNLW